MLPRREFLTLTAAGVTTLASRSQADEPKNSDKVRVGVMGLNRGQSLALDLAKLSGVEGATLCDVDQRRLNDFSKQFQENTSQKPETTTDFRTILDDKNIDALVCAAPNHWHGPATILACKAGKHVYVEKPCSHNPQEGEWMIEAAQKYKRCVQLGTQRRSSPGAIQAIEKVHAGVIGKVHLARNYYTSLRASIGTGAQAEPPATLNYPLWEGPAPHVPYRNNVVPYNWHWFWHWGGGELANNGVHGLDLCRWGLQVTYPIHTVSSGGRYWFDDDQETPDTQTAVFEFEGKKQITWQHLSCNRHGDAPFVAFFGDKGAMEIDGSGAFRVFDKNDKLVEEGKPTSQGQAEHLQNFVDAIRTNNPQRLNQPILEGHRSTLLCHLGNIAYRTGRSVKTDSQTGQIINDADQQALWRRQYNPEWEEAITKI
ncbi:MAG: Gfo/Idh/MocA family oxidoreductase [Pirellulaceae bacterium]|nr:Gfo/Idh/MocA family oxidoreductase [Pirellulaceae bacterium]